jgi:ribosomal-protein-alanine N-acetyltransferase
MTVQIVQLDLAALTALASGDLAAANEQAPFAMTDYYVGPECIGTWRRRAIQVAATPEDADWVTGLVVADGVAVGRAGFHAAPDADGMVEVGYSIDPVHRRRGHAKAALASMIKRARHDRAVRTVVASVSPDNDPSLNLIAQFGFVKTGQQWDDEDGLELVFELNVSGGQ